MAESKSTQKAGQSPSHERYRADDRSEQRNNYAAGASGEHQVSIDGQMGPDEISEPDEVVKNNEAKAHSDREVAGDQDIDTAGMIPGNKATDSL